MAMVATPSAGCDHSACSALSNGVACRRRVAMSGTVGAMSTSPRMVALSSWAMVPTVASSSGRSAAELDRDNGALLTYLYGIGALGALCWLWMAWAVSRRKRWARPVATTIFVLAGGVALFNLLVQEYGNTILPTPLGVLGVLPCLAGLVAVVPLWTRDRLPARA